MAMDKIPISRFSQITRLTQKALRLYDKKRILIPKEKNTLTGYRYYTISQIETGFKIKSLSTLGFSLEHIMSILKAIEHKDEATIHQIIQQRLEEISEEKKTITHIEEILSKQPKEILTMTNGKTNIKEIPSMRVISIRKIGTYDPTIGELIGRLCATIEHPKNEKKITVTGPVMSLSYDEEFKETDNDIECAIPFSGQITIEDPDMELKTYPACTVLSYLHIGSYRNLHETYTKLFKYIEEQGLTVAGPCRELYFNDPGEVSEEKLQTEIQIPIA